MWGYAWHGDGNYYLLKPFALIPSSSGEIVWNVWFHELICVSIIHITANKIYQLGVWIHVDPSFRFRVFSIGLILLVLQPFSQNHNVPCGVVYLFWNLFSSKRNRFHKMFKNLKKVKFVFHIWIDDEKCIEISDKHWSSYSWNSLGNVRSYFIFRYLVLKPRSRVFSQNSNISQVISGITKPILGMLVLIWRQLSWGFEIWSWNSTILTFFLQIC